MKKLRLSLVVFLATLLCSGVQMVSAAGKVSLTPASSSITEGHSQAIDIRLDSPIVATPPGDTVTLTITTSNPESVSVSPNTITYAATEWASTKSFALNAPANGVYGDSKNVLIYVKASSGSAYYDNYATGASVYVTDTTPAPVTYPPGMNPVTDPYTYPAPVHQTVTIAPPSPAPEVVPPVTVSTPRDTVVSQGARTEPGLTKAAMHSGGTPFKLERIATFLISSEAPLPQKVLAYSLMGLSVCAAMALPVLYLRRRNWQRKQRAKHLRWAERHAKSTTVIKSKTRKTKKV